MSDTPRTDSVETVDGIYKSGMVRIAFSRQLERELSAATAELAATKEQLRVAREAMELARGGLDLGEYSAADETLANAIFAIAAFTQPNLSADSLGGGNPAKGEGGVPLTFPA